MPEDPLQEDVPAALGKTFGVEGADDRRPEA